MRRSISLIILLLLCSHLAWPQTDSTVYRVALKTGKTLYGQIVAKEEGEFITLQKDDGGTQFLQWHEIEKYEATKYSLNSTELKEIAAKEAIAKKYANWNRGFLIVKSDTFFCWIEPKPDYSAIGPGLERAIVTASATGTEKRWNPDEYRKLVITEKDTTAYMCWATREYSKTNIFKIITDDPCKLLQDRYENEEKPSEPSPGVVSYIRPSHGGTDLMNIHPTYVRTGNRYYLLYNNEWIKTEVEDEPITDFQFAYKAEATFKECPDLVSQIKEKTFPSKDLRDIVAAFNKCISQNKVR